MYSSTVERRLKLRTNLAEYPVTKALRQGRITFNVLGFQLAVLGVYDANVAGRRRNRAGSEVGLHSFRCRN